MVLAKWLRPKGVPSGPIEYLVVGLGNPGKEYEDTRHNAGFLALDYIAKQENIAVKRIRFQSLTGEGVLGGKKALLLKPNTYMNLSGEAVREAMAYYNIPPEHIVVLCDDVALPPGTMRIRRKGSDGGQKGLRSISAQIESDCYPRIRIGVGEKPHPEMDLAAWVLSRFTPTEQKTLVQIFKDCHLAVELLLQGKMDQAMNLFNS